ncbi:MAG: aminodeoxychorismate synthase component I [Pseudomonadota bacterium]
MTEGRIQFDTGPEGQPVLFSAPERVLRADRPEEVGPTLDRIDAALASGRWVAGFASYELGYALEPRLEPLMPRDRDIPLICLGVFGPPARTAPASGGPLAAGPLAPGWTEARHEAAVRRILDLIGAGDIYQANLTFPVDVGPAGDPWTLDAALRARQPVSEGAVVDLPGVAPLVSRSPELFFATTGDGRILTRPMKGTARRDPDPAQDRALATELRHSEKDRAENLMIVDLLRNDLSRVCRPGSVHVPRLFAVETYATVHQMVSDVTGRLQPGTRLSHLLRALFPCGSVTGTPKIRAMQVIRDLEDGPRGAYCGAIGWMAPDGASRFNVAIRTLTVAGGRLRLGVGGGIVADSTPQREYQEALWKTRFAIPD